MRRWGWIGLAALIASLAGEVCPAAAQTVIRSPVAVLQNTAGEFSTNYGIGDTINQYGLVSGFASGLTSFNTYIASNPKHYETDIMEWLSPQGVNAGTIVYDLGAVYSVDRLALWNSERAGLAALSVSTSNDPAFGTSIPVGAFAPTANPAGQYPAEVFALTQTAARYVRLTVTGPGAGSTWNGLSMGEIAFSTADAPPGGAAVPEPSAALLFLPAFGLVALLRRRRFN